MTGLLNYNRGNFQPNANLTWEKKKRERYGLPTANIPNVAPSSSIVSAPPTPQPDNTMNTLQSLMSIYQSMEGKPTAQPAATPDLQAYKPASLEYNKPAWQTEQAPTAGLIPQAGTAIQTAPIQAGQTSTEQPKSSLMDYWKRPVWEGGMPLDQFVTLAGMLAHSIAPESVGGRMGAGLAGMAGPIYKERMAQEAKVAEPKKPQIESVGQRLYGIGGTAEAPVATALTPEPIAPLAPRYTETIKDGIYGEINPITQAFYPVREATLADKARIVEKVKEEQINKITNASATDKPGVSVFFDQGDKMFKANVNGEVVPYNSKIHGRLPSSEQSKINVTIARAGAMGDVFGATPTTTPGVYFDKPSKKFMMETPQGSTVLNAEQVKKMNLQYKEETPTSDIRVMRQSVPSVLSLVKNSREALNKVGAVGPIAGRWREAWAGKVGASDPNFTKLKTNTGLLVTRLMKMHVGARGGEYIMKHFQDMVDSGKQSPENMKAALDMIEQYANEVGQSAIPGESSIGKQILPQQEQASAASRFTVKEIK